jgi:hypothetical protein
MDELNQLLVHLHDQWLQQKAIDLNNLVKLNNLIRELNRKEHKPLYVKIEYTLLGQNKTSQGRCDYCQLHTNTRPEKNYLSCELTIWSKRKKLNYGQSKTVKYRNTINLNIVFHRYFLEFF